MNEWRHFGRDSPGAIVYVPALDEEEGHVIVHLVSDVVGQLTEQAVQRAIHSSRTQGGGAVGEWEEVSLAVAVSTRPSV